ncbi:hypothetical protein GCM10007940_37560 [Portibacter lacus]|uniref:Peptidase E n=2 Tax=Portibacter lacus TaxID=1099794 RepID=A0AA37WI09_9BACT|nr:DUF6702 family protein [Portibacter lacus]GLR19140.1 hypothetical protein GCM10007940_37560 [Portibacter lacus]
MSHISYNEEHHRIEIQNRIFYDDLEKSLRISLDNEKFDILKPEESNLDYDSLFQDYNNRNFEIAINDSPIELSLLEYEIKDDAIVMYLFKSDVPKINTLKVFSHILFEIFDDQDNVVSVQVNKKRKSKKFSYDSKPLEIEVN